MTKRYTAADFANARFAEHEDGRTAMVDPSMGKPNRWSTGTAFLMSDSAMADEGWVPVPTKPTITQSRFDGEFDPQWRWNVVEIQQKLEKLGIEIIPDPEPTNADRLRELHQAWINECGDLTLSEYFDKHGVTAPNVKGN